MVRQRNDQGDGYRSHRGWSQIRVCLISSLLHEPALNTKLLVTTSSSAPQSKHPNTSARRDIARLANPQRASCSTRTRRSLTSSNICSPYHHSSKTSIFSWAIRWVRVNTGMTGTTCKGVCWTASTHPSALSCWSTSVVARDTTLLLSTLRLAQRAMGI